MLINKDHSFKGHHCQAKRLRLSRLGARASRAGPTIRLKPIVMQPWNRGSAIGPNLAVALLFTRVPRRPPVISNRLKYLDMGLVLERLSQFSRNRESVFREEAFELSVKLI